MLPQSRTLEGGDHAGERQSAEGFRRCRAGTGHPPQILYADPACRRVWVFMGKDSIVKGGAGATGGLTPPRYPSPA